MTEAYIIACETLRPELTAVMRERRCPYPIAWIPSEKHSRTDALRECIQAAIDAVPEPYRVILLAFGFCGNSLVGVTARGRPLILPRVADCIPLFLGSQARRESYGPGTYFFTEGYLRSERTIIAEFNRCLETYGPEEGLDLMKEFVGHYTAFAVIDTGSCDTQKLMREIQPSADMLGLPVAAIPGNIQLLHKLLAGDWNPDAFLVIPPGKTVTLADALPQ